MDNSALYVLATADYSGRIDLQHGAVVKNFLAISGPEPRHCHERLKIETCDPIYEVSCDLSYDYLNFVIRAISDSDL